QDSNSGKIRQQYDMKNILSSLIAVLAGSYVIVFLLGLSQPLYPEPFSIIWIPLAGSSSLQSTLAFVLDIGVSFAYIISWIAIGLIIG
ncbi:MAG: hypothetical protein ACFFEE_08890, partial [Candidatus Thorarchaeota archaeon]